MFKDLLRCVFFLNDTVIDKHDTVCNLSCKSHFMCYNHHGHTVLCKFFHNA